MMELDDLRRQWQRPETAPLPVSAAEIGGMLAATSHNLIEKMRRNTWYEAGLTLLIIIAAPLYAWHSGAKALQLLLMASLLLLSGILLVNYYQQLQLLRRMEQPEIQVRAHLGALCAGLRQRLRFYYRLTLATAPLMLLLLLGFQVGKELAHPGPFHWKYILLLAAAYAAMGALVQVGVARLTRWYLQRLYGQHLDRLETSLRELDEPEQVPAG
ncbi:hypothetical protein ACFST9_19640 [Hymenobacter monticola]|uniref:Uncharacterized protein n=1 Tax=Hymenobacter monticola TaxID=1705399 RepID=A0ABY4AYB2_9BACT|nr:hypothetical protein [Hymenobacter monticola]UOE31883.1 hypothetical protein MTP16_12125 [Hymenobacter monticola]